MKRYINSSSSTWLSTQQEIKVEQQKQKWQIKPQQQPQKIQDYAVAYKNLRQLYASLLESYQGNLIKFNQQKRQKDQQNARLWKVFDDFAQCQQSLSQLKKSKNYYTQSLQKQIKQLKAKLAKDTCSNNNNKVEQQSLHLKSISKSDYESFSMSSLANDNNSHNLNNNNSNNLSSQNNNTSFNVTSHGSFYTEVSQNNSILPDISISKLQLSVSASDISIFQHNYKEDHQLDDIMQEQEDISVIEENQLQHNQVDLQKLTVQIAALFNRLIIHDKNVTVEDILQKIKYMKELSKKYDKVVQIHQTGTYCYDTSRKSQFKEEHLELQETYGKWDRFLFTQLIIHEAMSDYELQSLLSVDWPNVSQIVFKSYPFSLSQSNLTFYQCLTNFNLHNQLRFLSFQGENSCSGMMYFLTENKFENMQQVEFVFDQKMPDKHVEILLSQKFVNLPQFCKIRINVSDNLRDTRFKQFYDRVLFNQQQAQNGPQLLIQTQWPSEQKRKKYEEFIQKHNLQGQQFKVKIREINAFVQ